MNQIKTGALAVPGATLHYEVRGDGPVLLMICGGLTRAASWTRSATVPRTCSATVPAR